jgi:hypothetical protein
MAVTYTLAYCNKATITTIEEIMVQAPVVLITVAKSFIKWAFPPLKHIGSETKEIFKQVFFLIFTFFNSTIFSWLLEVAGFEFQISGSVV